MILASVRDLVRELARVSVSPGVRVLARESARVLARESVLESALE